MTNKRKFIPPIMLDVIVALLPLALVSYIAFGYKSALVIGVSVLSAVLTDLILSLLLLGKKDALKDGSAVITGLLLSFTLSPVTPWYMVAFGGAIAILFGKILWGGMGRNLFNPALVGREFMSVFFATTMTSSEIWNTKEFVQHQPFKLFDSILISPISDHLSKILYNTTGAIGEYSAIAIVAGGLYLIARKRISWHIPFGILISFLLLVWFYPDESVIRYSLGGILLGAIFMATDLPTSPSNNDGRLFYGLLMGIVTFALIKGGVKTEYMSFSILILNAFSKKITEIFRKPTTKQLPYSFRKIEEILLILLQVGLIVVSIISLNSLGYIHYLVYFFILYTLFKYISTKISNRQTTQQQTIK